MTDRKTLVVFHSSSGNTRAVAEAIAQALSADVEQIREVNPRPANIRAKGLRNLLNVGRVGFSATTGRAAAIESAQRDPSRYGLTLIGTPVRAGSVSPPVRAYLEQYRDRFTELAFFCTGEDPDNVKVFQQMEEVCGRPPRAVSAFHAPMVMAGEFDSQVDEFVSALAQLV